MMKVWIKLDDTPPTRVEVDDDAIVDDLKKAIKKELADGLGGVSPNLLKIFAAGADPSTGAPLNVGAIVPPNTTYESPLIVVAPQKPQQESAANAVAAAVAAAVAELGQRQMAVLNEVAKGISVLLEAEKKTIQLSHATQGTKAELMGMLSLPERGASWPNKPANSQGVDGFAWLNGVEDSEENRRGYMEYLRNLLMLPTRYNLVDAQPNKQLLTVENFQVRGMTESRKIAGTTDVAIAKSQHVRNKAFRNNIETLFELKKPQNMNKDHTPQAIGEHFMASYLNINHAVVSVLTDLNTRWIFFWFAAGEDDTEMSLYKLILDGEEAAADAKHLLDSIYGNSVGDTLPTTFAKRLPLRAVLGNKRARMELDGDKGHPPTQDSKPSSSSGGGGREHPGPGADSSSAGNSSSGKQSGTGGGTGGGSASMSTAYALSLFAPPAYRDVANELDLLDMVDADEQSRIVSSFALKYIVPYMEGTS